MRNIFCALMAIPLVTDCASRPAPTIADVASPNDTTVDMGTAVLWSAINLGAHTPFETGALLCWGESEEKTCDSCTWSAYRFADPTSLGDSTMTKYRRDAQTGLYDHTDLQPNDDMASLWWGKRWRTPTEADFAELERACRWSWYDDFAETGCSGYLATSRRTGNSIFFPAAGFKSAEQCLAGDPYGSAYWTSTLDTVRESGRLAAALDIHPSRVSIVSVPRYWGHSVRPVREK